MVRVDLTSCSLVWEYYLDKLDPVRVGVPTAIHPRPTIHPRTVRPVLLAACGLRTGLLKARLEKSWYRLILGFVITLMAP